MDAKEIIMFKRRLSFWVFFFLCPVTFGNEAKLPDDLKGVGITEHLGALITLDRLNFKDESGTTVPLAQYFRPNRPVILALVYFECPSLCNLILKGLLDAMKDLEWTTGKEFDLVAVSINPLEKPPLAAAKKKTYLENYHRPQAETGWHFLTGEETSIRSLAEQIGFKYRYIEKEKQYAHAAAIYILTPQGKISRYLYGTSFKANHLRMGLTEAAHGKIGTVIDRVLLFCFHFDPAKNSYTLRLWRVVQIVLTIQVLVGGLLLYILWRSDKKRKT